MKLKAYRLYDHAATLQPAPDERAWAKTDETVAANLALSTAGGKGWDLLCPYAVEATWNGGPAPEDIDIRSEAPDDDAPAFVQSSLGCGLLSCYTGYQFKTEATTLWVRGPINLPKDGLYPLESIVDTSLLPCTITINWKFTRPNQTIRFEAGEPFGALLPYPKPATEDATEHVTLEVVPLDTDVEAFEQALQQLIQAPDVQAVFQRLQAAAAPTAPQPSASAPKETAARWAAQPSDPSVLGIVFSRDRAMQLDATLRSFHLHCRDAEASTLHVIYKTTNGHHAQQYAQLRREYAEYGYVHFVEETDFRQNVLDLLATQSANGLAGYVLFLVDDNIFVRDFHLGEVCEALARHPAALGFSLRLGENITDMYMVAMAQIRPPLTRIGENMRLFDWTTAQGDFNYPLEVSSSVFRIDELASLLQELSFINPNTLESWMSTNLSRFKQQTPHLLCYVRSVAFCAPVNKVQIMFDNRAGSRPEYSAAHLAEMFDQGYRIEVDAYVEFAPRSVQQEVELVFKRRNIIDEHHIDWAGRHQYENLTLQEQMTHAPAENVLGTAARRDKPYKIGLLTIATGKYQQFIRPLYESVDQFFFTSYPVQKFLFTDNSAPFVDATNTIVCPIQHSPWPLITLLRYRLFLQYSSLLSTIDYLFYCDVDMRLVAECGEEMLPDTPTGLVGVQHPGFYARGRSTYTYETNPISTAYVAPAEGNIYYCGGVHGGASDAFLRMAGQLANNVDQDLRKNHIAVWHDESHLNRYFIDHPPKTLKPGYCYPEKWEIPFPKIVIALDKNHSEIRS